MSKKLKPGDKFGKLTVMYWQKNRKDWRCKCDCGNETNARSWAMKNGRHTSCFCSQKKSRPHKELPDNLALKKQVIKGYRKSAIKRNYEWNLSDEESINYILNICFYCGIKPNTKWAYRRPGSTKHDDPNRFILYNGIDRVDNNVGYTIENCVSCCKICNNSKSTLTIEEWKSWLKRVSQKMFNDYPEVEYTQVSGNGEYPGFVSRDKDIV